MKLKEDKMAGGCCTQEGKDIHTQVSAGNLKERDCLEDIGVDGKIKLHLILTKQNGRM
jgi:hypothetical protein